MAAQQRAAYRSLLRELARSSITRREERNRNIVQSVRTMFEDHSVSSDADAVKFQRDVRNAVIFLRSQRTYNELLDRYNPLHDMTQKDRVKATARRVGLDMPIQRKEGGEK